MRVLSVRYPLCVRQSAGPFAAEVQQFHRERRRQEDAQNL